MAGPFSRVEQGNRYILVIKEYFTKWTDVFCASLPKSSHHCGKVGEYVLANLCHPWKYIMTKDKKSSPKSFRNFVIQWKFIKPRLRYIISNHYNTKSRFIFRTSCESGSVLAPIKISTFLSVKLTITLLKIELG